MDCTIWSDALGSYLLSGLSDSELIGQWGATDSHERLRGELIAWARADTDVRRWIVQSWRDNHSDLVAAADEAATAGLTPADSQCLDAYTAEEMLLALLTDEVDDGRGLAQLFVNTVRNLGQRCTLQSLLGRLLSSSPEEPRCGIRVAVIGGHARDERMIVDRLFGNSPFEVRWKAFERKPSGGAVQRQVIALVRNSRAVLIITGMASHMLAQFAKAVAQRNGIPYRCIEKATDSQLKAALQGLFPEVTRDRCD
jgi:hypothetical protein